MKIEFKEEVRQPELVGIGDVPVGQAFSSPAGLKFLRLSFTTILRDDGTLFCPDHFFRNKEYTLLPKGTVVSITT